MALSLKESFVHVSSPSAVDKQLHKSISVSLFDNLQFHPAMCLSEIVHTTKRVAKAREMLGSFADELQIIKSRFKAIKVLSELGTATVSTAFLFNELLESRERLATLIQTYGLIQDKIFETAGMQGMVLMEQWRQKDKQDRLLWTKLATELECLELEQWKFERSLGEVLQEQVARLESSSVPRQQELTRSFRELHVKFAHYVFSRTVVSPPVAPNGSLSKAA